MARKRVPRTFDHAKLRELRDALGLTQEQLGERCGVEKTVVSHWEKNSAPRADMLPLVAEALGTSIDDLFTKAAS